MKPLNLIAVFIFYNISGGVQSRLSFSEEFKHCNVITFDGRDWLMLDFDRTGFNIRTVKCKDGARLIKNLSIIKEVTAIISVSINERKKVAWKPYLVRSCNEISRYTAGIDLGFTFNPIHLYHKLLKYNRRRNYELLTHWRRSDGISG